LDFQKYAKLTWEISEMKPKRYSEETKKVKAKESREGKPKATFL
jgi:hypothetical protein